jgi:hypothetical protein
LCSINRDTQCESATNIRPTPADECRETTRKAVLRVSLWNGITAGSRGGPIWEAQVNKGKIKMDGLTDALNQRHENGYILHQIYEHDGNTVAIWRKFA